MAPPPGTGRDLTSPSCSHTVLMTSSTDSEGERYTRHSKPSWISGTRRKVKFMLSDGCLETSRRDAECKCDVRGKAEKCLSIVGRFVPEDVRSGAMGPPSGSSPSMYKHNITEFSICSYQSPSS